MIPSVSVIIPVYKAESYICRCLESIRCQTLTDWECILVDDGSPDSSGTICDSYAEQDPRFKVIHKQNGGVSDARQSGLDKAQGEYVIHADPDDWVESTMLEDLYLCAKREDADIVFCDFFKENSNGQKLVVQKIAHLKLQCVLTDLLSHKLHGSLWNKLVRRSLFEKYGISFPKEVVCWEDLFVNCKLFLHDLKIAYVPKAYYHYDCYTNANSMVRKPSEARLDSQIRFCEYFTEVLPAEMQPLLYESKSKTKLLAFRWNMRTGEEIRNMFPEINERFCRQGLRWNEDPEEWAVCLCIKGWNYRFVRNLYPTLCRISHWVKVLEQVCKK